MQPQSLDPDARDAADLSIDESRYFGDLPAHIDNSHVWGLNERDGPLTRTTYVFQALYTIATGDGSKTGGIQLRARVHTYGPAHDRLETAIQQAAHRAAYMYDSGIQTAGYAPPGKNVRGTDGGDGYLTGFNIMETFKNWEREQITERERKTPPGLVDWSTEVYLDDSFKDANLSGIAQGIADPWVLDVDRRGGSPAQSVAPHKWGLTYNDAAGEYDVHPPGRREARKRYKPGGAGHDKTVHINGKPIGKLDDKGRTWLNPEYASGDGHTSSGSWGTYWSREGLVEETGATYQALRDGGVLYLTGETEDGIYLVTAAEKDEGYVAADPDNVSVTLRVREGSSPTEEKTLRIRDLAGNRTTPDDEDDYPDEEPVLKVECRRDELLIKHMGKSNPTYTHYLGPRQKWYGPSVGRGGGRQ